MGLRVLLTSHEPFGQGPGGQEVLRLARGLSRWDHQVRVLLADASDQQAAWESRFTFSVRRVTCRSEDPKADVPIRLPSFEPGPQGMSFGRLSEGQWQMYEERFRQAMQEELQTFDPQVIHCQYAWIHARLALETGLPYVVSVWGPELETAKQDGRFQKLVEQSMMGAARLLVPDPGLAYRLPAEARRTPGRVIAAPFHLEEEASLGARMGELYLSALEAWFGP